MLHDNSSGCFFSSCFLNGKKIKIIVNIQLPNTNFFSYFEFPNYLQNRDIDEAPQCVRCDDSEVAVLDDTNILR